jgi:hypothetical protein
VDSRSRTDLGLSKFPQPDLIASTSLRGRQMLLSSGVSQDQVIDVEALSYQYLIDLQKLKDSSEKFSTANPTVTLLGDFSVDETRQLLDICLPVLTQNGHSAIFKAHPTSPLNKSEIAKYGITEFVGDLGALLTSSRLVITTSFTSAAVDAYCLGIPLLLFSNGKDLNMSPLRLEPGVQFFHDTISLQALLEQTTGLETSSSRDFFNLDLEKIGKFSLISFNKVLEHVENPFEMLVAGKELLSQKSLIYIEVPDFEASYINIVRQRYNLPLNYLDDDHVHEFDREEMNMLINSLGMVVIDAEFRHGMMRYWIKVI